MRYAGILLVGVCLVLTSPQTAWGQSTELCGVESPCLPDDKPQYFPTGALGDDLGQSEFIARSFRNLLLAMHEGPLFRTNTPVQTFRLTEGYTYPRMFKLELNSDGSSRLIVKEIELHYKTYVESRNKTLDLPPEETQKLKQMFEAAINLTPPPRDSHTVLLDGRRFLVEQSEYGPAKYRVASLHSPSEQPFRVFYKYLVAITGTRNRF